ncbi:hypothetical protein GLAREA_06727 [Glarea lozoyensis ATCC 20868]|uniref:Uncharacterized protein n=1 Tax=Glarea lozoyensis (strain ATCC 20868 / MF5171) TaxID=1116229 RepID=S3D9B8_GLAL2|nr:uncharacterized protein GLAREA_06727 [Glarea lozoyensis ATCC 20868]EPE33714.1 hypothetical protein GLAREA_06727 [Glarea lozoyensis ATCC 20868]
MSTPPTHPQPVNQPDTEREMEEFMSTAIRSIVKYDGFNSSANSQAQEYLVTGVLTAQDKNSSTDPLARANFFKQGFEELLSAYEELKCVVEKWEGKLVGFKWYGGPFGI